MTAINEFHPLVEMIEQLPGDVCHTVIEAPEGSFVGVLGLRREIPVRNEQRKRHYSFFGIRPGRVESRVSH